MVSFPRRSYVYLMDEDTTLIHNYIDALKGLLDTTENAGVRKADLFLPILNCVGDGVIVADELGMFLYFNPAAVEVLGMGPKDIPKEHWSEHYGLFMPDKTTPFPTADLPLTKAIQGKSVDRVEIFVRNAKIQDGTFISATARPLVDEKGTVRGGVMVFRDISEELRRRDLLQSFLESAPDAMVICDKKGDIVFVNERTVELFGYAREELIDRRIEILIPERFRERHFVHRGAYAANPHVRRMGIGMILNGVKKDGTEITVEISLSPIKTPDGTLYSSSIRSVRPTEERRRS